MEHMDFDPGALISIVKAEACQAKFRPSQSDDPDVTARRAQMPDLKAPNFRASFLKMRIPARLAAVVLAGMLMASAGCKKQMAQQPAPRSDEQIASDIQGKVNGEGALSGQNIQVAVNAGVATLSGPASDDASRALAGNEAGSVAGVRTVVNNLMVAPPQVAAATPPPRPKPEPRKPRHHVAPAPAPAAEPEPPAPPPTPEVATTTPPPAPAPA